MISYRFHKTTSSPSCYSKPSVITLRYFFCWKSWKHNLLCKRSKSASNCPIWNPTRRKLFFEDLKHVWVSKVSSEDFAWLEKMSPSGYFLCTIISNQGSMRTPRKCTGRSKYCRLRMTRRLLPFRQLFNAMLANMVQKLVTWEWFEHLGRVNHVVLSSDGRITWSWGNGTRYSRCSIIPLSLSTALCSVWRLSTTEVMWKHSRHVITFLTWWFQTWSTVKPGLCLPVAAML